MSTHKGKDDSGPSGYKNLPKATADDDSVEGHQKILPRDAGPDGWKNLPKATGEDDDVEGHKK